MWIGYFYFSFAFFCCGCAKCSTENKYPWDSPRESINHENGSMDFGARSLIWFRYLDWLTILVENNLWSIEICIWVILAVLWKGSVSRVGCCLCHPTDQYTHSSYMISLQILHWEKESTLLNTRTCTVHSWKCEYTAAHFQPMKCGVFFSSRPLPTNCRGFTEWYFKWKSI